MRQCMLMLAAAMAGAGADTSGLGTLHKVLPSSVADSHHSQITSICSRPTNHQHQTNHQRTPDQPTPPTFAIVTPGPALAFIRPP